MTESQRMTGRATTRRVVTATALALVLAACGQGRSTDTAAADPVAAAPAEPVTALGSYLAARHAQQQRDYPRAAEYISRAIADDPDNADLVRSAFTMRVSDGHLDHALPPARTIDTPRVPTHL